MVKVVYKLSDGALTPIYEEAVKSGLEYETLYIEMTKDEIPKGCITGLNDIKTHALPGNGKAN